MDWKKATFLAQSNKRALCADKIQSLAALIPFDTGSCDWLCLTPQRHINNACHRFSTNESLIELSLYTAACCTESITTGEWKQFIAADYFSFLSSSFSLCHHHQHLCRHLPSHRCCFHLACCHHRALCSSITLHCNAGDHPLHLWAGVHHLWQGQQHLHWYDWCQSIRYTHLHARY